MTCLTTVETADITSAIRIRLCLCVLTSSSDSMAMLHCHVARIANIVPESYPRSLDEFVCGSRGDMVANLLEVDIICGTVPEGKHRGVVGERNFAFLAKLCVIGRR